MWREESQKPETGAVSPCQHAGPSQADSTAQQGRTEKKAAAAAGRLPTLSCLPCWEASCAGQMTGPSFTEMTEHHSQPPAPQPRCSEHKTDLQPGLFSGRRGRALGKRRPFLWAVRPHTPTCPWAKHPVHTSVCSPVSQPIVLYLPPLWAQPSNLAAPNLFGTSKWFRGRQFSHGPGPGVGGSGFRTVQAHYIYCALDF